MGSYIFAYMYQSKINHSCSYFSNAPNARGTAGSYGYQTDDPQSCKKSTMGPRGIPEWTVSGWKTLWVLYIHGRLFQKVVLYMLYYIGVFPKNWGSLIHLDINVANSGGTPLRRPSTRKDQGRPDAPWWHRGKWGSPIPPAPFSYPPVVGFEVSCSRVLGSPNH